MLGYVTLRPGLLIATRDPWEELIGSLPSNPSNSYVLRTRLVFSQEDSRRMASELWDVESIAARYHAVIADSGELCARAERQSLGGAAALRAFAAATLPVFEVAGEDPDLPEKLLPANWPGEQLGAALGRAFEVFGSCLTDYVETLTDRGGSAPS
jgi:DNA-binding transcriptional regulator PaaX